MLAACDSQSNPVDSSAWIDSLNTKVNAWRDTHSLEGHVLFYADTAQLKNHVGLLSSHDCLLPTNTDNDFAKLIQYLQAPPPPPPCVPIVTAINASWVPVKFIGVPTDVTETVSVTHSQSTSNTSSESWGHSVEKSASAGFSFWGASASVHVTGTTSHNVSTSYSQTFEQSSSESHSVTLHFQPGEVWQFQFNMYDKCHGYSTVTTQDLVQTPNLDTPPCCLAGYFLDPKNPSGQCVPGLDGQLFNLCQQAPPSPPWPPGPPPPSPPSPSPPAPPGSQYRCSQGMCVTSPSGVTKAECDAGCTAQFYSCINSTCAPASSGVSKQVCTAMCSHK